MFLHEWLTYTQVDQFERGPINQSGFGVASDTKNAHKSSSFFRFFSIFFIVLYCSFSSVVLFLYLRIENFESLTVSPTNSLFSRSENLSLSGTNLRCQRKRSVGNSLMTRRDDGVFLQISTANEGAVDQIFGPHQFFFTSCKSSPKVLSIEEIIFSPIRRPKSSDAVGKLR